MQMLDVFKAHLLREPVQDILVEIDSILARRNKDKLWGVELKGYLQALKSSGYLHQHSVDILLNDFIPEDTPEARVERRRHHYSIDIFAQQSTQDVRKYQFNVPAENPFDAYAKLSQRHIYNCLGNIKIVQVFNGFKQERLSDQDNVRTFKAEELISPPHPKHRNMAIEKYFKG